ncbi:hypothetical protein PHMEG_0003206 [Phytophthora megakarya]|uniref:C3HC-type domain-containing protein n=1 Tax=Phytophthora megakarya TaxID=4795 RepID=A0A225WYP1_9STRA|nr:hypothetical protein PHMEG_0003206 [Phytophthora megakarya]
MAALGSQMDELLAAWDDATAPLDARVREDPLLFAPASEIVTSLRVKRLKGPETKSKTDFCRPWDHSDFLARVSSFSIASWFAKPDVISAFECARHGWSNSAADQLHCNCCKQFLCFKIDDKLSEAGALKVAATFAGQLVTGHAPLCPWRGNPSPEAFTTLPIATKRQVYETFMNRLEEVLRMHEVQKRLGGVRIEDAVIAKVLKEAGAEDDVAVDTTTFAARLSARISYQNESLSSEAMVNAAIFIICGWKFHEKEEDKLSMVWCESCNRRWQAFPDNVNNDDEEKEEKESEPPNKRLKTNNSRVGDLLSQHRHYCPWVAERKSSGVNDYGEMDPKLWEFVKLPGWKQYAQSLLFLGNPAHTEIVASGTSASTDTKVHDPVQALESIRAVLGI